MRDYDYIFKNYMDKSIKLLESLYQEEYEQVIQLLNDRELLIDEIRLLNLDSKCFNEYAEKYNIKSNEAEIKALMTQKITEVKFEMQKLELGEKANKFYNKGFYDNNKVFSKKV